MTNLARLMKYSRLETHLSILVAGLHHRDHDGVGKHGKVPNLLDDEVPGQPTQPRNVNDVGNAPQVEVDPGVVDERHLDAPDQGQVLEQRLERDPQRAVDVEVSECGAEPTEQPEAEVAVAGPGQVHVHDDLVAGNVLVDLDAADVGRDPAERGLGEVDLLEKALLLAQLFESAWKKGTQFK